MKKRLSKPLWYGTGVDSEGNPIVPKPATSSNDLEGLHEGELFLHLKEGKVTLWSLSADGAVVEISGGGGVDLSQYLLKSVWDKVWEIKTDSQGNEYIFGKLPVVTQYGITMYADGGELDLPSIYAGLPIDGSTLIRDGNGVLMINPDIDLGGASTWDELIGKPTWIGSTKPSYNYSEILQTPDLSVYALVEDLEKYVTLNTEQTIAAHKNFLNGLSVGGLGITKSQDDVVYIDANLVVRGGITMYADNTVDVGSIYDGLPIDGTTIYWENGKLKANITEGVITNITSAMVVEALGYTPYNASNPKGYISGITSDMVVSALGYTPLQNHQTIYALTIQKNGTTVGTYTPNSAKKTINIVVPTKVSELDNDNEYATTSDLDSRIDTLINGAPAAYDTLKEIADVLAGNVDSIGDIITTLGTKADKAIKISAGTGLSGGGTLEADRTLSLATSGVTAGTYKSMTVDKYGRVTSGTNPTTLAGYGITDAYTKSAVVDLLGNYVTLKTAQTITGEKNFTGGLKVNGSPIVYDATNKYWKLEGDLLVTGGVTMFASDSAFTPSTIMDAIATDGTNLKVVNGVLTFVGSIDGGEAGSVAWENVEGKPSWIGASKPSYSYSEISGTPTLLSSFTNDLGFIDSSALNGYLLSSNYTASDILAKLKTVDGEGSGLDADLLDGIESKNFIYQSVVTFTSADDLINQNQGHLTGGLFGAKAKGWNNIAGLEGVSWGYVLMYGQNAYTSTSAFAGGGLLIPAYGKKAFLLETSGAGGSINIIPHRILTDNIIGNYNAGSATKLQTARTIWGQSFDGTADISGDLTVGDGNIILNNDKSLRVRNASGEDIEAIRISSGNILIIGKGIAAKGYNTYLDGKNIHFKYGTSQTTGMILHSSGNVLIGATTDSGYKLDVIGDIRSTTNVRTPIATIDGIPIYKSQDDVLYIDGNLAVRGGITMYATDAIDVPSIIEALPSASSSAKGIASFNPNDFSVVDGYVSFIGSGGVDESVLADYAKKTDLSAYLPLSGGQMTGNIGYTLSPDRYTIGLPAAGYFEYSGSTGLYNSLAGYKSFLGSAYNIDSGAFFHVISVRHRNGLYDENKYGLSIIADLNTTGGNLKWNKCYAGDWQGERVILDSVNWSQYVTAADGGNYLPLSGGTLAQGSQSNTLTVQSTMASSSWITPVLASTPNLQEGGYANIEVGKSATARNLAWFGFKYYGDGSYGNLLTMGLHSVDNTLIINGHGYVGINTISPRGYLHVEGDFHAQTIHFIKNGDYFDQYGNMYLSSVAANWNVFNNAGTQLFVVNVNGNVLAAGGITMYSDIRKKTKLKDVELTLQQIANAPLIEHYYNSDAMRTTHVGSIAQYWAGLNDWFCKKDSEGFYTMEIQNAALASAISIARELVKYESKTDRKIRLLKDEVKRLKKEIKILKSA